MNFYAFLIENESALLSIDTNGAMADHSYDPNLSSTSDTIDDFYNPDSDVANFITVPTAPIGKLSN